MKLCVVRRECGPARVPRSTLWTGLVILRLDMDFLDVVFDKLSAGTVNDELVLMSAVTWYSGFPLDMKVQAVDGDGNGVSLTSVVFKAIKPEEVGSLVSFDFNAESSAKLRFFFWP